MFYRGSMPVLPRAQHVWVSLTGVWADDRVPGLLLSWRSTPQGWEGWVISAQAGVGARGDGPYVRQSWLPATAIRPLGPLPQAPPHRPPGPRGAP